MPRSIVSEVCQMMVMGDGRLGADLLPCHDVSSGQSH